MARTTQRQRATTCATRHRSAGEQRSWHLIPLSLRTRSDSGDLQPWDARMILALLAIAVARSSREAASCEPCREAHYSGNAAEDVARAVHVVGRGFVRHGVDPQGAAHCWPDCEGPPRRRKPAKGDAAHHEDDEPVHAVCIGRSTAPSERCLGRSRADHRNRAKVRTVASDDKQQCPRLRVQAPTALES